MAESNATTNLRALLYALQGKRREIAQSVAQIISDYAAQGQKTDSTGSNWGRYLKIVQEQIEAVERAIKDEERIAREAESSAWAKAASQNESPKGIV